MDFLGSWVRIPLNTSWCHPFFYEKKRNSDNTRWDKQAIAVRKAYSDPLETPVLGPVFNIYDSKQNLNLNGMCHCQNICYCV